MIGCRFRRRENLGSESILHFDLIAAAPLSVLCKIGHDQGMIDLPPGSEAVLAIAPGSCHFFDEHGQRIELVNGNAASSDITGSGAKSGQVGLLHQVAPQDAQAPPGGEERRAQGRSGSEALEA